MSNVQLYMYDLSNGLAAQFSQALLGKRIDAIWHTAIVVYDVEWFYGGGIWGLPPGTTPFGKPVRIIELGRTEIPQVMFEEFLDTVRSRYTAQTYHLLRHNCNTFTEEAAMFLVGGHIPAEVSNLPQEFLSTPLGAMLAPTIDQIYQRALQNVATMPPSQSHAHVAPNTLAVAPSPATGTNVVVAAPTTTATAVRHPHLALRLPSLSYVSPVLFETGDTNTIVTKLRAFVAESAATTPALSAADEQALARAVSAIQQRQAKPPPAVADDVNALVQRLLTTLPADKVFPAVDLLRLLVLLPSCNAAAAQRNMTTSLVRKYGASAETPRATLITLLRLVANMFAHATGARTVTADSEIAAVVQSAVFGLSRTDNATQIAAATVIYNLSLYLRAFNTHQQQIVAALCEALAAPSLAPDADNAYNLLMSLGHFLFVNDDAVRFVKARNVPLQRFAAADNKSEKTRVVAAEVQSLLNAVNA